VFCFLRGKLREKDFQKEDVSVMFKLEKDKSLVLLGVLLLSCCLSGCRCGPPLPPPIDPSALDGTTVEDTTLTTTQTGIEEGTITEEGILDMPRLDGEVEEREIPELQMVHFDYDKHEIRPEAASILKANAVWLLQNMDLYDQVKVDGHCDERGTNKYNIVLGERRANTVRDFLIGEGIPGAMIIQVSYGEEVPLDPGHSEEAWRMNRRAEFRIVIQK